MNARNLRTMTALQIRAASIVVKADGWKQANAEAVQRGFPCPFHGEKFNAAANRLEAIAKEIEAIPCPVPAIPVARPRHPACVCDATPCTCP